MSLYCKNTFRFPLAAVLLASFVSADALAGVILDPIGVTTNMGEFSHSFEPITKTIDQTGLSTPYTSGVDDFDTYTASANPCRHQQRHYVLVLRVKYYNGQRYL